MHIQMFPYSEESSGAARPAPRKIQGKLLAWCNFIYGGSKIISISGSKSCGVQKKLASKQM